MPYLMISFTDTLTNDIISFEQLGPAIQNAHADLKLQWAHVRRYTFGSIVYNQVTVYKRQNVLKVVVHVIIID